MSTSKNLIVVFVLVLIALTLLAAVQHNIQKPDEQAGANSRAMVRVGETTIVAEVADTKAKQLRGLSGRPGLARGAGMLFVFDEPGAHGIWMKDMQFSIDILWANSEGTITTIEERVSPDTYPDSFYPNSPTARYVLEVPSNFVNDHGIAVGDKIVVQ